MSVCLLNAWKNGDVAWAKLEATAAKIGAATILPDNPDLDKCGEELRARCAACKALARRAGRAGPVYMAME